MGLSKLLKKVNKAKSAINSLKGISSKINSLGYTTQTDKLGEEATKALNILQDSRKRADTLLAKNKKAQSDARTPPSGEEVELMYPINDVLDNYIAFSIRPRRKRSGETGANLFSDGGTEITLYVPEGITSDSSVSYGKSEVGVGARGLDKASQSEGFAKVTEAGGAVMDAAGVAITKVVNSMTGNVKNIREGRATNPMIETTFEGVDFRSFGFTYEFWPKSKQEADMVNRIIFSFRTAMLPDTYGGDGLTGDASTSSIENYFNFPNIFDVAYEGPIAKVLDGFLPMVCTQCEVDHFNGGRVATFVEGQPVSTKMTLAFQEIKILSQESYQEISPFGAKGISSMSSLTDESQPRG
tara:strand:- start:5201 stop:6265 length:1065 start_codon:yes stop_codon:yes gene_type:complete